MSSCASVRQITGTGDTPACPAPESYPENPTVPELIYALNDTYLAWEACHQRLTDMQ